MIAYSLFYRYVTPLTPDEAGDLMARAERSVSPVSSCYEAYRERLILYSEKETQYGADCNFLLEADEYLRERKLPGLQNVNGY